MLSSSLPRQLYRAEQVRELDRLAIEEHGIAGSALMEKAGSAAFGVLQTTWPEVKDITVFCGTGNNGGDGYVLARLAHDAGIKVRLLQVGDAARLQGDARQAADALVATGFQPEPYAAEKITGAGVFVDALLGTGLDREISGELKAVIENINLLEIPVFAIDIPSGLNADTGQVMGSAVQADATITFIGLKQGLFTAQGKHHTGQLFFNDLDVPHDIYTSVSSASTLIDFDNYISMLPVRSRAAHKGHFGHVLIIGGDSGFIGAARMAGEAAARVGAGLVSLATRDAHAAVISAARPEIMSHGVEAPKQLLPLLEQATVIAIGPGLGQSRWAEALFSKVLESRKPVVLDADALNLLAREPGHYDQWILTPHPGEAARLLGCDSAAIQNDRFAAIRQLQEKYNGVIVLKGSGSLVIDPAGDITVCHAGNPGMASGGMGDVLTGIIAGLQAQGLDAVNAARMGVCLHARAADMATADGERGMLASDLMPWLRRLVNPGKV